MIIVTGGAGFIGSHFVVEWLAQVGEPVTTLDALTYAGNRDNLRALDGDTRHQFVHGDIRDRALLDDLLQRAQPRAVVHFAAESHVDRSIDAPAAFMQNNVLGTFALLEATRRYWAALDSVARAGFRFLQISTDEVFGSLAPGAAAFSEDHPQRPNSPYAASKAAADHLVRAWHQTYGLPVLTVHASNSYGPRQFPEKLIPLMIHKALLNEALPVYGDGQNVRDWLHVRDHCRALRLVLSRGRVGESYNVGGGNERSNIDIVERICTLLDDLRPSPAGPYRRLISFVADRPGHDRRYAVDSAKIARDLGWQPSEDFDAGLRETVHSVLDQAGA